MNPRQKYWQHVGRTNGERLRQERLADLERMGRELPDGMTWGPETTDDDPYGADDEEYWRDEE